MVRFVISAVLTFALCCQGFAQSLVPYPNSLVSTKGKDFCINANTRIVAPNELKNEAEYLKEGFREFQKVSKGSCGIIRLSLDSTLNDNPEHYVLQVNHKCISINGATAEAVFDGIETLLQLVDNGTVPAMTIDDAPAFGYRALLLDPARHFLPVSDVKRYIDEMVRYKFNHLQIHLCDDQGWRIEIKSHPELTDSIPHYTQQDIRDLIDYAAKRHVDIIPEIDIPAHTFALLKNHKELLCDCIDTTDLGNNLRTDVMLCASKPETYTLMEDILREVCNLFTSEYIHLGGDESVIEKNWGKCKSCQALIKEKGIGSNNNLMGYFFGHFLPQLHKDGKRPILWCEMDNIYYPAHEYLFDYPKDVTLVTWRNALTPKAIELTREHGNNLIMAPGEHCYFDYPQGENDLPEFNNWGMPQLNLQQAYDWEELDPQKPSETVEPSETLEPSETNIIGVMGTLWGEAIPDINRAFYMTYPRALALSEMGWTNRQNRDWNSFKTRIPTILNRMMLRGIPYRVPYEIY